MVAEVLVQTCSIVDDGRMQAFGSVEALFKGRHFDGQIIVLCVSWYTSFKLSLRDLVIMMADRGIRLTHTTILRWVQHYLPEFEKRWNRYARPVGGSWRMDETYMDETYIKVRGSWVYLYRAVDKAGQTVDFFLSRNRDVTAAKTLLRSAMRAGAHPPKSRWMNRSALTRVCTRAMYNYSSGRPKMEISA
jgi:transposase-like protein